MFLETGHHDKIRYTDTHPPAIMRREKLSNILLVNIAVMSLEGSHAYAYGLDKLWRQIQPDFGKSEG